jgi:hypothetical protein
MRSSWGTCLRRAAVVIGSLVAVAAFAASAPAEHAALELVSTSTHCGEGGEDVEVGS